MNSLLDLVKLYGDARAQWAANGVPNFVPEALAPVEERIDRVQALLDTLSRIDPQCECFECETARTALRVLDGNA